MTFLQRTARIVRIPILALVASVLFISGCTTPASDAREVFLDEALQASIAECAAHRTAITEELSQQKALLEKQNSDIKSLSAKFDTVKSGSAKKADAKKTTCAPAKGLEDKLLLGQLERVWLPNLELALNARIDTGAETASLDARNIELFERNGRRWVRFEIEHPDKDKKPIQLERKLARTVIIVQSNSPEPERRPVIKLGITIGHVNQTAEFTLTNRSHLDHQVLIGRNILQDVMIVDVSKKNVAPYVATKASPDKVGSL